MFAYGVPFADGTDPLTIEFAFIRAKGYIKNDFGKFGRGLFYHYHKAMCLLWPDADHHRWSDLMLKRKTENDILVMMGASDTNKTFSSARYVLTHYWASPDNTLWLVSSTELRGAELRIWGKIKDLFNEARGRYPWLKGTVLDAKTCITTEQIDKEGNEARPLTKGIIFIPCKRAENWEGLGSYAGIKPPKNGRLGHCGDEVSFMESSFLQAYANWYGKENFEGILQGNITDTGDPLGIAGEPEGGWQNWTDTGKTQEWRSRWYGAWVIAFDGRDSPNNDYPGDFPRFPYLIGTKKLKAVAATEGEDSPLFQMQCVGKPRPGAEKFKVLTLAMCESLGAFASVIWGAGQVTDVLGLDAAYGGIGGDRCSLFHSSFGEEVGGQTVFACRPPILVPIKLEGGERAEVQITRFCKAYAESHNIPPGHFFFDARATLAVELAQWSTDVTAVDFGGPATDRPVSEDEYIDDPKTKQKRLKTCVEHYSKFVTELWFSVRYAAIARQIRQLPRDVAEEGSKRQWKFTKGQPPRIEIETKEEMKLRTKRSPDLFDSLAITMEGARRLGFQIKRMKEEGAIQEEKPGWLEEAQQRFKRFLSKHELNYKH